jgi:predicted DsbA family dithiol-disulfide isomerase
VGAYTDKKLVAMAEAIGLDMEAFNACFDSGQFASRVLQDGKDGVAAGAEGTPYFVITYTVNGELKTRVLYGAEPFGTFEAEILGALAEMGLQ